MRPILIGLSALILSASSAQAAVPSCMNYSDLLDALGGRYNEAPIGTGAMPTNQVLEIFRAQDNTTWTAVVIMPSGLACVVAAGKDWQSLEWQPLGLGS